MLASPAFRSPPGPKASAHSTLPELHTHALWLQRLERAGFVANKDFKAWGSAGPDFLLFGNNAIIEVKKDESPSAVKAGLDEALDRTDARFLAKDAAFIAVITPEKARVWHNVNGVFADTTKPDVVFDDKDFKQVIELFKHTAGFKLPLDEHLESALKSIYGRHCPDSTKALKALLHLHQTPFVATKKMLFFGMGTPEEFAMEVDEGTKGFIVEYLVNKYWVRDREAVRSHVRHNWSHYQPESKKAGLGKYYTPVHPVELVREMLTPVLTRHPDAYVADLAAGCGAFIGAFDDYRVIGRDIDAEAVEVLVDMGFANVQEGNSLLNVSRKSLNIGEDAVLVINGNPPWNDASSMNKRYGTDKKAALALHVDADVKAKDLGLSFLKAYGKLNPAAICVLHPLSYLIKRTNFRQLGAFAEKYRLVRGAIFSSNEFADLASKTPFPVIAALYEPGAMTFEDMQRFAFEVCDWLPAEGHTSGQDSNTGSETRLAFGPTGMRLVPENVETIDGLIRKYPPTKGMDASSDIGLYQYNIRDTNSLTTSGALSTTTDDSRIPVQFSQWRQYAYLNCYKRHFGRDFTLGNLSPLVSKDDLTLDVFLDACGADAIASNQSLAPFKRGLASFVSKNFVINDFRRKAKAWVGTTGGAGTQAVRGIELPNFYQVFVEFWDARDSDSGPSAGTVRDALTPFFRAYFEALRARAMS